MNRPKKLIAIDCGNSSYRMVLGTYENGKLNTEVLAQESNCMVRVGNYYYWDILKMYQFLITTLKNCVAKGIRPDGIGICTWGVDFGLFDVQGNMIGDMLSYRNTLGEEVLNSLSRDTKEKLFFETGILSDRINSVYLLTALKSVMPSRFSIAEHLLMVPDIFSYMLTGNMVNEPSELSTTQLMDVKSGAVSSFACDTFGIPEKFFSPIGCHGELIGEVHDEVKREIGIKGPLPVICVPSHDTAAAVTAIPAEEEEFLFISSGTWALIGAELNTPIITQDVLDAGLTNESGVFGKTTLLKNSTGMFILEKMKNEYELENGPVAWEGFLQLAASSKNNSVIFVNDPRLFNPVNMTKSVRELVREKDKNARVELGDLLLVVMSSMAEHYRDTIHDVEKVTGKTFDRIHIVGGGVRNDRINQITAERTGKTVITCGEESTCLGNLGVQLKYFDPELTLKKIRKIIGNSINQKEY